MITYLKETFPRAWIQAMKGVKPGSHAEKVNAIIVVGGLVDLKEGSAEANLLGHCVRYSMQ